MPATDPSSAPAIALEAAVMTCVLVVTLAMSSLALLLAVGHTQALRVLGEPVGLRRDDFHAEPVRMAEWLGWLGRCLPLCWNVAERIFVWPEIAAGAHTDAINDPLTKALHEPRVA